MTTVTVEELAGSAEALLGRVEAGEWLAVTRGGRVVAELRPALSPAATLRGPRPIGLAEGHFVVPDNFDDPLPEDILRAFEGR